MERPEDKRVVTSNFGEGTVFLIKEDLSPLESFNCKVKGVKIETTESLIVDLVKRFNDKWKDNIYNGLPCDYHGLSYDIRKIIKRKK